jgi:hypothetical protein
MKEQLQAHVARMKAKHKSETLRSMELKHAENGGFIATHRMEMGDGPYKEPKEYALKNHRDLIAHVKQHMCPSNTDGDKD